MTGIFHSVRFWLALALVYVAGSLSLLSRLTPDKGGSARINQPPLLYREVEFTPSGRPPLISEGRRLFTFNSRVDHAVFDGAEGFEFKLAPSQPLGECSVQAIMECDHHQSFSHTFNLARMAGDGFRFSVPLRHHGGYWKPVGHDGEWIDWNITGLRRFQVKLFAREPIAAEVSLHYSRIELPEKEAVGLAWCYPLEENVALGDRFELAFDITGWRGNPFDYTNFRLMFEVAEPDGNTRECQGFLFQNFESFVSPQGEKILPKGAKHWRARFRPLVTGTHKYRLLYRKEGAQDIELAAGAFDTLPGKAPEFIRISPKNQRYFEKADGSFFYPFGWCLIYPVDKPYEVEYVPYLHDENSLSIMLKMVDDLADCGGNFMRFWMTDWWSGIEWNKSVDNYGGLGRYNLKNAWIIDRLLEHCRERGVYVVLETMNHVRLAARGYGWDENPFNRRNGGFLDAPLNYWTDPLVRPLNQKRMDYIVARWADQPAVQSWNYLSEPDNVSGNYWSSARNEIYEAIAFMKKQDPYQRLISNHMCNPTKDMSFYADNRIEFIHTNAYPGLSGFSDSQAQTVRDFADKFAGFAKPVVVAEYGGHWAADPDWKMGRDTIAGLWGGICSRLSGAPLSWWWNYNYGDDMRRYYRIAADFLQGEDLIAEDVATKGFWRERHGVCANKNHNLQALMVGNDSRRFIYLYNFDTVARTRLIPTKVEQAVLTFSDMRNGSYLAEFWNPRAGKTGIVQRVDAENGSLKLEVPDFEYDLAIKIYPLPDGKEPTWPELVAGKTREPEPDEEAAHAWLWKITPFLQEVQLKATPRCVYFTKIAAPDEGRGCYPVIESPTGGKADYAWDFLPEKNGWEIWIKPTEKGEYLMRAVPRAKIPPAEVVEPGKLDEDAIGLTVSIDSYRGGHFNKPELFRQHFLQAKNAKTLRVGIIDQIENPAGENDWFVAYYRGPLFVPEKGTYTFAINSDDGSFLSLDGEVLTSWLGGHEAEIKNRPLGNNWLHKKTLRLEAGVHWLEYYHQEGTGWQMARVGWLPEGDEASAPNRDYYASPYDFIVKEWQVIPAQYFDGKIPCRVQVLKNGVDRAEINPCAGLELRKPLKRIYGVNLKLPGNGAGEFKVFDTPGRRILYGAPVWVDNSHWRRFSLEWEAGRTSDRQHFIKSELYDISLPLSFSVSDEEPRQQVHEKRKPGIWNIAPEQQALPFIISYRNIPLARGTTPEWPGESEVACPPFTASEVIEPTLSGQTTALPAGSCAGWLKNRSDGKEIVPQPLRINIWTVAPSKLKELLAGHAGAAVVLPLDPRPALAGMSSDDLQAQLHAVIAAIRSAGANPVLLICATLDLNRRQQQQHAICYVRTRDKYGCPLVDLRLQKKQVKN
jgi:hypothetical protein